MENKTDVKGFLELVESRRSVRIFDEVNPFDHDVVQKCLEKAVLAPNSSNLQLWEFYRVPEYSPLKADLAKYCMGQKAATTARELVVIVARRDKWKSHAAANYENIAKDYAAAPSKKQKQAMAYYGKLIPNLYKKYPLWSTGKKLISWAVGLKRPMVREVSEHDVKVSVHKSAALAAMTFMYAMKAMGYDTCPMEGIDSKRIKKLLKLPAAAEINMVIGCGQGLPEGTYGERFRIPAKKIIFIK
jgi:nitroreductase